MNQVKRWCFTLNNWSEEEYKEFVEKLEWSYLLIGKEVGEEGTPHLQGYVELKTKKSLRQMKLAQSRTHWEALKGKPCQAATYCKKDGDWTEWGTISYNGKKEENFTSIVTKFRAGGMRAVLEEPPKISQLRLLERWATYLESERQSKPFVHWIWGASGTGKSRLVYEEYSEIYWKDDTKWWDGYDGHETICMDDFRGSNMRFTYLLRLLDRYPMRVEVKGGYRQIKSQNIVITSILHPESVYQMTDEPLQQLIRRIDKITETNKKSSCGEQSVGNTVPHFAIFARASHDVM